MNIPDNITCGMCTYYDYHTDDCAYANNREVDKDGFYIDEPPCRRSQEENAEQSKAGTENNGDLISRSELLKEIEKYKFGAISNDAEREYIKNTILDFITGQPTAYSVDGVVAELEERKALHERLVDYEAKNGAVTEKYQHIKAIDVLNDAIEIVKQGGVSDDVCE